MANERPETGPMTFADDWRGVFLRGDSAFHYLSHLRVLLDPAMSPEVRALSAMMCESLATTLASAYQFTPAPDEQRMRPFAECVAPAAESTDPA